MQDHSQRQAAEERAVVIGDTQSSVVQTDVLKEKDQRARPVVKVGHQLQF